MFSEKIQYQLDFAKKSKIFPIVAHWDTESFNSSLNELKKLVNNSKNINKLSIVSFHETFLKEYAERVMEYMNTTDIEYYLSAATSAKSHGFFDPLVNIFFWRDALMRYNIKWTSDKNIRLFDKKLYEKIYKKTNKGILSMRKETKKRQILDSIIDKDKFEGIYRFINYPNDNYINLTELNDDVVYGYPTANELIQEYNKSYISFVVESCLDNHMMTPLTEKTLIAFLTRTMPIVLGGKNYVKELKDMGFYVWNDEFGFEDGDVFQPQNYIKVYKFNNCIENYNKMSKSDIADMYNSNIDKIENNYKIVSELLFDTKKTIL